MGTLIEYGMRNAECGMALPAFFEYGIRNTECGILYSVFRIPYWQRAIPHSAFRIPYFKNLLPRRGFWRGVADFFQLIRWPNLLIVAATQLLVWFAVLAPTFQKASVLPHTTLHFLLEIIAASVLACAGGYVINDFFDQKIDRLNRPERRNVVGLSIGPISTWLWYKVLIFSVLALTLLIHRGASPFVGRLNLWLFPTVVVLLFIYSKWLKCTPILGNLLVAGLCAVVPLVVFFQEKRPLAILDMHQPELAALARETVFAYSIFAFLTTILRELVKDLEDQMGDSLGGCRTAPVVFGSTWSRRLALFEAAALYSFLLFYGFELEKSWGRFPIFWAVAVVVLGPMVFIFLKIWNAQQPADFKKISLALKILMAIGLALLGFFPVLLSKM